MPNYNPEVTAELLALAEKATGHRKALPPERWKWMRAGVLDNTGRCYIYAGHGNYGKHYHATANTEDDAAFIASAPLLAAQLREADAEVRRLREALAKYGEVG